MKVGLFTVNEQERVKSECWDNGTTTTAHTGKIRIKQGTRWQRWVHNDARF